MGDMLPGMGLYADLVQQVIYPNKAYDQINLMTKPAWAAIPKEGTPVRCLSFFVLFCF